MEDPEQPSALASRRRLALLAGLLAVILVAGLNPRGRLAGNGAGLDPDGGGLRFEGGGIAYTTRFIGPDLAAACGRDGLSIEAELGLVDPADAGFTFLAQFHDGREPAQLLLGQWGSHLIVMNGDDYDHRRREPRIPVDTGLDRDENRPARLLLTVTSGPAGSRLYIDGRPVAKRDGVVLRLPAGGAGGRLVLGNSAVGKHAWRGTIGGFALHRGAFSPQAVAERHQAWARGGFAALPAAGAELFLDCGTARGTTVPDQSPHGRVLMLPPGTRFLERRVLEWPPGGGRSEPGFAGDVALNLLGFVPFGWVLASIIGRRGDRTALASIPPTLLAGLLLSLAIEIAQSWMPERSSSALDLLLNTVGTGLGATAQAGWRRARSARDGGS